MGTKVMVRATRSFNGRVEGEWYWVDPDDRYEGALIRGGYYAHQEPLLPEPAEVGTGYPRLHFGDPTEESLTYPGEIVHLPGWMEPEVKAIKAARAAKGRRRGQVGAEPGEHPQDSAGEGPGAGDPDRSAGAGRGEEGGPA